jgi:hypothetical protein
LIHFQQVDVIGIVDVAGGPAERIGSPHHVSPIVALGLPQLGGAVVEEPGCD